MTISICPYQDNDWPLFGFSPQALRLSSFPSDTPVGALHAECFFMNQKKHVPL